LKNCYNWVFLRVLLMRGSSSTITNLVYKQK